MPKERFVDHFDFYRSIIGNKLYWFLILNILLGLIDSIGLAMFIPLLAIITNNNGDQLIGSSLGKLEYLLEPFKNNNIPINTVTIILLLIIIFSIKGLLKYTQVRMMANMRFKFIKNLRLNLLNDLSAMTYLDFVKIDAGKIQNNLTTEITKLFGTMTNYFMVLQAFSMLIIYITLIVVADYKFAMLAIIGGYFINRLYKIIIKHIKVASINITSKSNEYNSHLIQAIHQFKYLKSTNRFNKYAKRLKQIINESDILNLKIGNYQAINEGIKDPIAIITICSLLILQVYIIHGDPNTILISILILYRCITQYGILQTNLHAFHNSIGSIISIKNIQNEIKGAKETQEGKIQFDNIENIILDNIELKYEENIILEHVNLKIKKNTTIALIGKSGSGKTSLANIIIGLNKPTSGKIKINNVEITQFNLDNLRNKIGYILQEPVIFNESIFNNITFFEEKNETNYKKFLRVIEQASLADLIDKLPRQEETILGDNGVFISGGQKQRISIARELYNNKELILFDEATSSLDFATERIIQTNIEKLSGVCTVIIIAHRLSTIKNVDHIYILENNTIQDSGTYEYLEKYSTTFKKIIEEQFNTSKHK